MNYAHMAKFSHFYLLCALILMNTQLSLYQRTVELQRWPLAQKNRTLQAWDSADEYLIQHLQDNQLINEQSKVLIINDGFGALSCWLGAYQPFCSHDSYVSVQGCIHNNRQNGFELQPHQLLPSTADLPADIDLVLLKIPKNNGYLSDILAKISQQCPKGTRVIAGAKTTDIHTSSLKLFERFIGPTTTSLAKKKSRLIFSQLSQSPQTSAYPVSWSLENASLEVINHANVFSRDSLDIGARLLLAHLPDCNGKTVIDLGCGNGVIGLSLLSQNTLKKLTFVDESYMAIASAKDSVNHNFANQDTPCQFVVDDCLTTQAANSADIVICNPPFHQQQAVTDHIAWQMFKDAHRVLRPGGQLTIVGNRNLAYHIKLKRLFGAYQQISANKKFVVLTANKTR